MPATKKPVLSDREIVRDFCRLLKCYGFTQIIFDYDYDDDGDGGIGSMSFTEINTRLWPDYSRAMSTWNFEREYVNNDKQFIPSKKYIEFKNAVERLIPEAHGDRGCYGDMTIDIDRDIIKITHNTRFIRVEAETLVI